MMLAPVENAQAPPMNWRKIKVFWAFGRITSS